MNNVTLDSVTAAATVVLALTNSIVLIYLIRQTRSAEEAARAATEAAKISRETLDRDHERRRKQSTVEFWMVTREMYYKNYRLLGAGSGLEYGGDQQTLLREYLGMLEMYAIGINDGLFDFDTARSLSGGFIVRQLERFCPYMENARARTAGRSYAQLLRLQERLAPFAPVMPVPPAAPLAVPTTDR